MLQGMRHVLESFIFLSDIVTASKEHQGSIRTFRRGRADCGRSIEPPKFVVKRSVSHFCILSKAGRIGQPRGAHNL
jgi:hypothetical protein